MLAVEVLKKFVRRRVIHTPRMMTNAKIQPVSMQMLFRCLHRHPCSVELRTERGSQVARVNGVCAMTRLPESSNKKTGADIAHSLHRVGRLLLCGRLLWQLECTNAAARAHARAYRRWYRRTL